MNTNHSKYFQYCLKASVDNDSQITVLIIINGKDGNGMSVLSHAKSINTEMPSLLRLISDTIESEEDTEPESRADRSCQEIMAECEADSAVLLLLNEDGTNCLAIKSKTPEAAAEVPELLRSIAEMIEQGPPSTNLAMAKMVSPDKNASQRRNVYKAKPSVN